MGMEKRSLRAVFGISSLMLAGVAVRCTNTDVLRSEPGQSILAARVSPAGSSKYEAGSVELVQVLFRPEDPAADQALGNQPYSYLASPKRLDLTTSVSVPISSVGVSEGVYRVVSVRLQAPSARDFDFFTPTPPPTTTCLDGVLAREGVNGLLPPPEISAATVNEPVDIGDFSPVPTFRIDRGGQGTLTLTIDGTAFLSLFEAAFTCQSSGTCRQGNQDIPAPCMSSYAPLTADQVRPLLGFQ